MNNYEKMTLESFIKKLHAKDYKGATGARRAVGKSQDLSNADKDKARAAIDKFFGVKGPKQAAKKIAPKAKTAPKKAAKKIAAKSKVTHAKPAQPKPAVKRQPLVRVTSGHADPVPSTDARVMRQHSASQIFGALYGKHPLDPALEAKLLHASALEYLANSSVLDKTENPAEATPAITKKERVARPRVNLKTSAAEPQPESEPAPTSDTSPTNGVDTTNWTEEQIAANREVARMKEEEEAKLNPS